MYTDIDLNRISLELLTKDNLNEARKIHREDIPEDFVDNVDTIMELTQYGLEHNCKGHTYVVQYDGAVIGIILLGEAIEWETDPPEMKAVPFYRLMGFVIDKRYRGLGIGAYVLEKVIRSCYQEFGVRPIALGCHKDNSKAARFYESHGFHKTDVMEGNDYYYLRYPKFMLYHGSIIKGLETIKANARSHTNNKNVAYFTEDRVYALICCRKREENFVTMGLREGKQHYFERFPNQLEVLYKGKVGYLYKIKNNNHLVHTTMHTWESDSDVIIDECEVIEDLYQEILKEEAEGNVVIHRYDEIDPAEQKMHANYIREHLDDENNAEYREFLIEHFSKLWD